MKFKQKAEEKKMSMSKNIARLAVTAGLTAALSFGGVMAPVTMAFAAEANGSVTIGKALGNDTEFMGYKIFDADVAKDESGKTLVSNIAWANGKVEAAVKEAITKIDKDANIATAQDAADWISEHVMHTGKTTSVASDSDAYKIAAAVAKVTDPDDPSDCVATSNGVANNLSHGYWLFVTDALTVAGTETATAPIFAVVGDEAVSIAEKTSIPTVDKQILAATSDDPMKLKGWAGVADSQIGQEVTYKLTGKVADNYATYDSYAYKFTDTLSNGLDYVKDSLKVYAVDSSGHSTLIDRNAYSLTTPSNDNRVLTVDFAVDKTAGKKGLKDIDFVDADTEIVVFYKAKLNKNAVTGNGTEGKGNYNAVKLEYSNNPYTEGNGTSVEGGAGDFTFKLNLNKVDQGTEKGLGGAVFTIQSNDENKYVASKDNETDHVVAGQLVSVTPVTNPDELPDYVKFTSSKDESNKGMIEVKGLDAGSYTVTEIKAPSDKYTVANPFTFTIEASYKKNAAELENITVSPSENDKHRSDVALGTLNSTPGDNTLTATDGTVANVGTGEINITVGNTKSVGLPLTGLNGVTFTWIAGGAVLVIGVAHLIRSRKQAEESEQE